VTNSAPPSRSAAATIVATGGPDRGFAATPHLLASHVAIKVMERGGNAVDAAIAANAVQGVVAPDTCGVGGDLFAMVHRPGDKSPLVLNASGAAGSGVSADQMRAGSPEMPYRHPWTITVPGCVAGWAELATRFGALPLQHSLGPAIELAVNGFPVSPELADSLARIQDLIRPQPAAAPLYINGEVPAAGTTLRRPQLARTLQEIADDGAAAFYRGRVGDGIIAATAGAITRSDLDAAAADWVDPIGIEVFGLQAWTVPPNTQGYLTLAACWLFEQLRPDRDPSDPSFVHAAIEAYRAIAWERDDLVADPRTAPLDPNELLATDRLSDRLAQIDPDRLGSWPQPATAPGGTAYLCVRDRAGVGVSLIQSNFGGIGTGISAGDTGVFLHNRGAGFNLIPGHPNELTPGRRPLHTLSPTLWTHDGDLRLLLGTRGGHAQPQLLLQVATHLLYGDGPRAACQTTARWLVGGGDRGGTDRADEPATIQLEEHTEPEMVAALSARGYTTETAPGWNPGWGPVSLIQVAEDEVFAAVDPRVSTTAAVVEPHS